MDPLATAYPTTSNSAIEDWVSGVTTTLDEFVATRPIAATLAAAAAGAGVIALLSMQSRTPAPRPVDKIAPRAQRLSEAAQDGVASLKTQIADLIAALAERMPAVRAAAVTAGTNATDAAADKVQAAWDGVRGKSEELLKQARPHVDAAAEIAREHPVWLSVAAGVIGALVGAQLLGRRDA